VASLTRLMGKFVQGVPHFFRISIPLIGLVLFLDTTMYVLPVKPSFRITVQYSTVLYRAGLRITS
jgi:hypothetical protein